MFRYINYIKLIWERRICTKTYMCDVNVNIHITDMNFTKSNAFATEPIAMMYLVYVTIQRPFMKHDIMNGIS